jgi:hypothetical protein
LYQGDDTTAADDTTVVGSDTRMSSAPTRRHDCLPSTQTTRPTPPTTCHHSGDVRCCAVVCCFPRPRSPFLSLDHGVVCCHGRRFRCYGRCPTTHCCCSRQHTRFSRLLPIIIAGRQVERITDSMEPATTRNSSVEPCHRGVVTRNGIASSVPTLEYEQQV